MAFNYCGNNIIIHCYFIIYKKRKKKKSIEAYKYNPYISPIEEVKQSLQQLKDNNGITQMNAKSIIQNLPMYYVDFYLDCTI